MQRRVNVQSYCLLSRSYFQSSLSKSNLDVATAARGTLSASKSSCGFACVFVGFQRML